jgi:HEAT repeat protein
MLSRYDPTMLSQRNYFGLLVCVFIGLNLLQAHALNDASEPVCNGRSLNNWLAILERLDFDHSSSTVSVLPQEFPLSPEWCEARDAIRKMGTNAIPFLIKSVCNEEKSAGVVAAFQVLGTSARSAVPKLASLATNNNAMMDAQRAMFSLTAIGPEGLPILLTVLTNNITTANKTESVLFYQALECIKALGTNAAPAIPVLIHCTRNTNDLVAVMAMRALPVVGVGSRAVFAFLIETANGTSANLRFEAVDALVVFREQAISTWVQAFNDPDYSVRYRSYLALADISPWALTNATVISVVARDFQSEDPELRQWGAQVLRSIGQQAHGEKPDCMVPVDHENFFREATNVLRQLHPELLSNKVQTK